MISTLKNIRILILFGSLDMGGAERQGLLLARYLKERESASVKVWGLGGGNGPVAEQCDKLGIPWKSVKLHWGLSRRFFHLMRLVISLRKERPEILISYTKVPNIAAALLWRLAGVRLCIWNQSDAGLLLEPTLFHRSAVAQVNHFIANSEGGWRYLVETFGLPPSTVIIIRNGIMLPPPCYSSVVWRDRLKVGENAFVAVMVANLSSYKDHGTLLDAWCKLICRCDDSRLPVLVLAGRFDDRAEILQNQAKNLGIAQYVRFLGDVDDVSGLLSASDLCVHCSPSEGIPNAVLEAMASGLAIVGSDIPGLREAVGDTGRRFLAPPHDSSVLSEILESLIADKELRRSQGELMQKRAAELFGLKRMCCETVEYLKSCLWK